MRVEPKNSTTFEKPENFRNSHRLTTENDEEHLKLSEDFSFPGLAQTNRLFKIQNGRHKTKSKIKQSRMRQSIFSSFQRIAFNKKNL